MTDATALTPERARDLGRSLAFRLHPRPGDSAQLAEMASFALLSLLPTWLPPGEEGCAAALRQLVRDPSFAAYVLAPAVAADADAAEVTLKRHLDQCCPGRLQPLLLLFAQGCRQVLHGLPASGLPPAAAAPAPVAAAVVAPVSRAVDAASWPGLALAAALCFGVGWLGYQLTQGLGRSFADPELEQVLAASPGGAAGRTPATPSPPSRAAASQAPATAHSSQGQPAALASLRCLAGGQAETAAPADPSNYGPRLARDWQGRPVPDTPQLIVLHETVVDEDAALTLFRRRNSQDGQQASYHVLIGRDGRRLRLVPDAQRAFGAGDSRFEGLAVQLKPGLRPSVNNIALHVSLVSPSDGADGEARRHSGYTPQQYRSLAAQIAQWQALFRIPASRVVTHQEVDRSRIRRDPRSLDWQALGRELHQRWLACGVTGPVAELRR